MNEMSEKEFVRGTGKGVQVSGDWRKKHEDRMRTVGVVRGEKRESEKYENEVIVLRNKNPLPLPILDKVNSLGRGLGEGWEW